MIGLLTLTLLCGYISEGAGSQLGVKRTEARRLAARGFGQCRPFGINLVSLSKAKVRRRDLRGNGLGTFRRRRILPRRE